MSPAYGYDDDGQREHQDCDWCGAGSCRDGSKCGLKPVEDYPGDDYDPLGFPCGHKVRTRGCGGCDPGAVAFTIDDFTGRVHPAPCLSEAQTCEPARGYRCPVHYTRPPAPPLSPEEREIVDRFEAAQDGLAEDCTCGHDGLHMDWHLSPCPVIEFCACGARLRGCVCGDSRCLTCDPYGNHDSCWETA